MAKNENVIEKIIEETGRAVVGKDDIIKKILMAILSGGHVLLDDVPGVGKTTLAMAFGRVLGLEFRRIQFTPDVMPSDIVGFSIYDRQTQSLKYVPGIINNANILLGDEINRTSSKTQSALLEAMEENSVTVDGNSYELKKPFFVIATQNSVGSAGTQPLPNAELDRFLIKTTIGYPDNDSQMEILRGNYGIARAKDLKNIINAEQLIELQKKTTEVFASEEIIAYVSAIVNATRESDDLSLGISPRGALALLNMSKASALVSGRDYVIVEDVLDVVLDVACHRIILSTDARMSKFSTKKVMKEIIEKVPIKA